jgi:LysR family hydrogen peroxide-inducible transcriptional activator
MPQRTICLAWRRNKVRHDDCVELAKIIRGSDGAVLAA